MMPQRTGLLTLAIALCLVGALVLTRCRQPQSAGPGRAAPAPEVGLVTQPVEGSVDDTAFARLNLPSGNAADDVKIVQALVDNYLSARASVGGPPIGFNEDLVAALTGKTPAGVVFLPPHHPAINGAKQLCDRWGTPYFLHPLSAERIEVRSAGPDKKLFTVDDIFPAPR